MKNTLVQKGLRVVGHIVCIARPVFFGEDPHQIKVLLKAMKAPLYPNTDTARDVSNILESDDFDGWWKKAKQADRTDHTYRDRIDDYGTEGPDLGHGNFTRREVHHELDIRPLVQKAIQWWVGEPDELAELSLSKRDILMLKSIASARWSTQRQDIQHLKSEHIL